MVGTARVGRLPGRLIKGAGMILKIVLLLLLLASPCFAQQQMAMNVAVIGAGAAAAGGSGWFGVTTEGTILDVPVNTLMCSASGAPSGSGTCTVSKISIYGSNTPSEITNLKLGFYTDSSGQPGSLIGTEQELATIGALSPVAWHEFTLPTPQALTCGTTYWICYNTDRTDFGVEHEATTGVAGYHGKTLTYTTAWPTTYGTPDSHLEYKGSIKAYFTY
jgi:hypothetical protein